MSLKSMDELNVLQLKWTTNFLQGKFDRLCKNHVVTPTKKGILGNICRRITLMHPYKSVTFQSIKISNYGFGGYFDKHYDSSFKEPPHLQRITTVLVYVSVIASCGGIL